MNKLRLMTNGKQYPVIVGQRAQSKAQQKARRAIMSVLEQHAARLPYQLEYTLIDADYTPQWRPHTRCWVQINTNIVGKEHADVWTTLSRRSWAALIDAVREYFPASA